MDTESTTIYVKFGPKPTEEMRIEWAEGVLTQLKADNPALFGKLLMKVIGAVK